MTDYYESICKLYEKTMQRLEAEDCQGGDYRFLKGEAHAYFTAMQLSEFHSTADEPPAPELTDEMAAVLSDIGNCPRLTHTFWVNDNLGILQLLETSALCKLSDDSSWYITDTGRAAFKAHQASMETQAPHCACGNTENLTEVIATPDGTYHLCREHFAEENLR